MDVRKLKAFYLDDILKFGGRKIWENQTVRGVGLSRKTIQKAYKEIHERKFKGNIIDYLCYICLLDVIWHISLPAKLGANIDIIINFMYIYLGSDAQADYMICKLLLKDDSYLNDAFEENGINKMLGENSITYNRVKEFFVERINYLLNIGKPELKNPYDIR